MTVTAGFLTDTSGNRRFATRRPLQLAISLGAWEADAVIHDLSVTGLLLETAEQIAVDDILLIDIPNFEQVPATVVWNSGRLFGCKFHLPIPTAAVSGALLRNPFSGTPSLPGATDANSEIHIAPFATEKADDGKLSFSSKLVVALVLAVAVSAPIAAIAAFL